MVLLNKDFLPDRKIEIHDEIVELVMKLKIISIDIIQEGALFRTKVLCVSTA